MRRALDNLFVHLAVEAVSPGLRDLIAPRGEGDERRGAERDSNLLLGKTKKRPGRFVRDGRME